MNNVIYSKQKKLSVGKEKPKNIEIKIDNDKSATKNMDINQEIYNKRGKDLDKKQNSNQEVLHTFGDRSPEGKRNNCKKLSLFIF